MKDFLKKRAIPYGIAVAVALLVHLYIKYKYGYLFAVNDDIFYRSLSNGTLTGEHESNLIYISNVLGYIFKGLYTLNGTIEWYSLFMIFAHYCSWILLAGELGAITNKSWKKFAVPAIVMAVCIIIDMERVVLSTFTSSAACFGAAGLIFLALFLFKGKKIGYGVIATVCCVLSFLTRHEVFITFIPLMAIFVMIYLIINRKEFALCIKSIIPYCLALGFCIGAIYGFEAIAYSSSEWKEYLAFNDARTIAHDYCGVPDFENREEAYSNLGWDYDDYIMMKYAGPSVFEELDSAKMYEYANIARDEYQWQLQWKKNALIRFFEDYWNLENSALKMIAFGLCISLCIFFVCNKCASGLISILLGSGYHILYGTYLIYKGRFPERICHVILLAIIVFYIAIFLIRENILIKRTETEDRGSKVFTGVKILAVMTCLCVSFLLARDNMNDTYKTVVNRVSNLILLRNYCDSKPENVYCIEGSAYGAYSDYAFGEGNPKNLIVTGSWLPKSPHFDAWMNRFGMNIVYSDLAFGDNVYLIRQVEESEDDIVDFYADNNINVSTEVIDVLPGDNVKVVKISAEN